MLRNQAKEIVEEINGMKAWCMKKVMDDADFSCVDPDDFQAFGMMLKLLDMSCDYMIKQAEMMDDMNDKLDKLLAISERKGS